MLRLNGTGSMHKRSFEVILRRCGAFLTAFLVLSLALLVVVSSTPPVSPVDEAIGEQALEQANQAGHTIQLEDTSDTSRADPLKTVASGLSTSLAPTASKSPTASLASIKTIKTNPVQPTTHALVIAASGQVTAKVKQSGGVTRRLRAGDIVPAGYEVVTGPNSSVDIEMPGPARIRLGPDSAAVVEPGNVLRGQDGSPVRPALRVNVGTVLVHVLKDVARWTQFAVETPTAVAGVRGTMFDVRVSASALTRVSVWEGQVAVQARGADKLEPIAELVGAGDEVVVTEDDDRPAVKRERRQFTGLWAPRQDWLTEQRKWEKEALEQLRTKAKEQAQQYEDAKDRKEAQKLKAKQNEKNDQKEKVDRSGSDSAKGNQGDNQNRSNGKLFGLWDISGLKELGSMLDQWRNRKPEPEKSSPEPDSSPKQHNDKNQERERDNQSNRERGRDRDNARDQEPSRERGNRQDREPNHELGKDRESDQERERSGRDAGRDGPSRSERSEDNRELSQVIWGLAGSRKPQGEEGD